MNWNRFRGDKKCWSVFREHANSRQNLSKWWHVRRDGMGWEKSDEVGCDEVWGLNREVWSVGCEVWSVTPGSCVIHVLGHNTVRASHDARVQRLGWCIAHSSYINAIRLTTYPEGNFQLASWGHFWQTHKFLINTMSTRECTKYSWVPGFWK